MGEICSQENSKGRLKYTKFGVEIYVAAKKVIRSRKSNSALKFVIDRTKQAQCQNIIDKAIDKAKGNTDRTFTEGRYEVLGQIIYANCGYFD